ncbi:hypothetical protein CI610_00563 [invertebrate metagenome]|uniref:Uncharacterized protein n=1 Tax=invertebrate metagenome TaxID=1711999 RepID=A0A2H9TBC6_9ZZZZ
MSISVFSYLFQRLKNIFLIYSNLFFFFVIGSSHSVGEVFWYYETACGDKYIVRFDNELSFSGFCYQQENHKEVNLKEDVNSDIKEFNLFTGNDYVKFIDTCELVKSFFDLPSYDNPLLYNDFVRVSFIFFPLIFPVQSSLGELSVVPCVLKLSSYRSRRNTRKSPNQKLIVDGKFHTEFMAEHVKSDELPDRLDLERDKEGKIERIVPFKREKRIGVLSRLKEAKIDFLKRGNHNCLKLDSESWITFDEKALKIMPGAKAGIDSEVLYLQNSDERKQSEYDVIAGKVSVVFLKKVAFYPADTQWNDSSMICQGMCEMEKNNESMSFEDSSKSEKKVYGSDVSEKLPNLDKCKYCKASDHSIFQCEKLKEARGIPPYVKKVYQCPDCYRYDNKNQHICSINSMNPVFLYQQNWGYPRWGSYDNDQRHTQFRSNRGRKY